MRASGVARATCQHQVDQDDGDRKDDADQSLGEDAEGAAGGEGVAEEARTFYIPPFAMRPRRMGHPSSVVVQSARSRGGRG